MIDFDLATKSQERVMEVAARYSDKTFVRDFLYQYCHYLTVELAALHDRHVVRVFFLKDSTKVIHSALDIGGGEVLDAIGYRGHLDIEALYNATNSIIGIFDQCGECLSELVELDKFDPDVYYAEVPSTELRMTNRIKNWYDKEIIVDQIL